MLSGQDVEIKSTKLVFIQNLADGHTWSDSPEAEWRQRRVILNKLLRVLVTGGTFGKHD